VKYRYAYTLTISRGLYDDWGFFEDRGYLPAIPGELLTEWREEVTFGVTEPEAWQFREDAESLGEGFLACVADPSPILDFLDSIV
jgi:hypothetical protein